MKHTQGACLDDSELFNYGDHWEKMFELLPELADPRFSEDKSIRPKFTPLDSEISLLRHARTSCKEAIRQEKILNPEDWHENPHKVIYRTFSDLHYVCTANYVIINDREAFETGHARIVYVDSRQNIVREARFEVVLGSFEETMLDWFDITLTQWLWEDSEVGEKY
ncbi:uncharacterized protein N7483_004620 [Penicillium malachiteum]|uniref:uncharacterized protein n=1 Tax=Penicillium malachiteum TaxID=1324776 RepID=UPI002546A85A|nr:uncharacterized protein N7483_004620 [Penicillium malachiteum]KAJ5730112.1 hypothetical protein N7483_004620 [Penicillium malachiteum]